VLLTTVLIVVLVVIGVVAVVSVPLMIRSTRRQVVEDAPAGSARPIMGSPAQVWVSRGERVLRELGTTLGENAALHGISADAAGVVAELRLTAGQVAGLDHALSRIPVPSLEDERRALTTALAEADGRPAATDLARSHEAVSARIAAAQRQRDQRDALLAKMQATVTDLERARDELAELLAGTTGAPATNDDAAAQLTGRLDALREGLVEVRQASDPEIGPHSQG
jgi:truncated hemoglobin YjbI